MVATESEQPDGPLAGMSRYGKEKKKKLIQAPNMVPPTHGETNPAVKERVGSLRKKPVGGTQKHSERLVQVREKVYGPAGERAHRKKKTKNKTSGGEEKKERQ